jgi:hypothetical protein
MSVRTFCDRCNKDVTQQDHLGIQLNGRSDNRRWGHWDLCIDCARKLDIDKLLESQVADK